MELIERKTYLNHLIELKDTPDIKIITGVRRSGKSRLMQMYIDRIRKNDENCNIIYIDFVDLAFDSLKEYHALHSFVEEKYDEHRKNYLFIDEVQLCPKFELAINSLHAKEKYDIYLTGSNAFLLSSDLATLFTGRFIEIHVFPFSFSEYCTYFAIEHDLDKAFDDYVFQGGLAGSYPYRSEKDRIAYISDVYKTIIERDLVSKYNLSDTNVLSHISDYLMDSVGNITSPNKLSDTLCTNKISTNHVTVGNYINYLANAFMFYEVKRYDIRGKKYLSSLNKYYLVDTSFRYSILGTRNMDFGHVYENLVALEFLRRGYELYVGKLYEKEVDFVATRQNEKLYIQVSDNISDENTFQREVAPLMQIKDAYPKILLARTHHTEYDYNGIRIIDLVLWLRGTE